MTDKNVRIVISGEDSGSKKAFADLLKSYRDSKQAADEMRLKLAAQRQEMDRVAAASGKQSEEYRKIRAEVKALTRDLGEADRFANGFAKSLGQAGEKGGAGMASLATGVKALAGAVAAVVSVREVFSVLGQFDRLNASLRTVTGSAAGAESAMAMLKDLARQTPYELNQLTEAYIRLRSLGLDASRESLISYGNTAAAMGKPIMQFIEAVADASTGEFERLKEFGIKARKEGEQVSFTFQGTTTTVRASADEITRYLTGLGNTQFAGGMKEQMSGVEASLSNLKDAFSSFVDFLGNLGIRDAMKGVINSVAEGVQGAEAAVRAASGRNVSAEYVQNMERLAALQQAMAKARGDTAGGRTASGSVEGAGYLYGQEYVARLQVEIDAVESRMRRLRALQQQEAATMAPPPAAPAGGAPAASATRAEGMTDAQYARYSQHAGAFAAATQRYGLPPGLLAAVAWQESGFNPNTNPSRAGAQGMMQFMPGTARRYGLSNPRDGEASIDAAGRYFKYLMGLYAGQEDQIQKAIASYNAGEGRVMKLGLGGTLSRFSETRKYVPAVLGNMRKLGNEDVRDFDLDAYQAQLREREALWQNSLDRQQTLTESAVKRSGNKLAVEMAGLDQWLQKSQIEREIALIGKTGEDRARQLADNARAEASDLRAYAEARARLQNEDLDGEARLIQAKDARYRKEIAHLRESGAAQSEIEALQIKAQSTETDLAGIQARRQEIAIKASESIAQANAKEAESLYQIRQAAEEASRALNREMPDVFAAAAQRRVSLEEDPAAYMSERERLLSGTKAGQALSLDRANQDARDAYNAGTIDANELEQVLKRNQEQLQANTEAAREFGMVMTSAAGNAITQWQGFGNFFQGLAKDIAQVILKITVLQPMEKAITGALSGFSFGGLLSAVGLHSGGIVGSEATFQRAVPLGTFTGAPRFHTGGIIGPGEVPIIARKGEGVFTPEQMAALGGNKGLTVNVIDQAGVSVAATRRSDGMGGDTLDVVIREKMAGLINSGQLDQPLSRVVGQRTPVRR